MKKFFLWKRINACRGLYFGGYSEIILSNRASLPGAPVLFLITSPAARSSLMLTREW